MKSLLKTQPLGVVLTARTEYLFFLVEKENKQQIKLVASAPRKLKFKTLAGNIDIGDKSKNIADFKLGKLKNGYYFLTYKVLLADGAKLKAALSRDLIHWKNIGELSFTGGQTGALLSLYKWKSRYLFYYGEGDIRLALSSNLASWRDEDIILQPRPDFFDASAITLIKPLLIEEGILVTYYSRTPFAIGAALFNKKNPKELLWRSHFPIWDSYEPFHPIGAVAYGKDIIFYLASSLGVIREIVIPKEKIIGKKISDSFYFKRWELILEKHEENPIISPRKDLPWESQATFNPAAFYDNEKVHLIYRAIGESNISVLGYAASKDGIHFDERLEEPIYLPRQPFEYSGIRPSPSRSRFISGGGWGGCEDPRITKIGDKYFMTYVAFDGFRPPRVALTSIKAADFHNHNWNWSPAVLISPPGVVDKNCVIFPEKVKGKYVIMHRIFPNILIDFVDSLDFDGKTFLEGRYLIRPREAYWDSRKIGAGAPPIKTDKGWLLIYHAVDDRDPGKYKIGAMLLDLEDPTKVLCRSNRPILEPTHWYENEGYKAGVAYPCGAVVKNDRLFVYYGGADTVVCVASKNIDELLTELEQQQISPLEQIINPPRLFAYN